MRKAFLFLGICLMCLGANAQKIDKALLAGKWKMSAMTVSGQILYRDSTKRNLQTAIKARRAALPGVEISAEDSIEALKYVAKLNEAFALMSAEFDANGNCTMSMPNDDYDKPTVDKETAKYKWVAENRIEILEGSEEKGDVMVIAELTKKKLVLTSEGGGDDMALSYTRE